MMDVIIKIKKRHFASLVMKKNGDDALECNKEKICNFHKFIPIGSSKS